MLIMKNVEQVEKPLLKKREVTLQPSERGLEKWDHMVEK
jgi:hypothetical protein